jgi:hypothetical protein
MLEIIIALLMMWGVDVNSTEESITVIDERSGTTYGLGNTGQVGCKPGEGDIYVIHENEDGTYTLKKL